MARIRTIKPDFFRSRSLARCSRDARLTFQGLWCEADDHGRGIADPRLIKGTVWPLDDDITAEVIDTHLHDLSCTGHVRLYEVDGERYYEISAWSKHQSAAYRRGEAVHPLPPARTSSHDETCNDVQPAPPDVLEGKGREGKGEEVVASTGTPPEALDTAGGGDIFDQAARLLARAEADRRGVKSPTNPDGVHSVARYVGSRTAPLRSDHEPTWRRLLDDDPDLTAQQLADHLLQPDGPPVVRPTVDQRNPTCTDCGDTTFVLDNQGDAVPCPHCRPDEPTFEDHQIGATR